MAANRENIAAEDPEISFANKRNSLKRPENRVYIVLRKVRCGLKN